MKLTFLVALALGVSFASAQVKKSTVEGVTNFAQVETTVACAGAVGKFFGPGGIKSAAGAFRWQRMTQRPALNEPLGRRGRTI